MGRHAVQAGKASRTSAVRRVHRALWWLGSLSVLALAVEQTTSPVLGADERPNVLFLLSDDQSAPYVGCYGYPGVRTPNLDRFAAQGMRFDRMFVTCSQCVPSRASLMTGRSPVAVRTVRFTAPLPPDVRALPDLLRDARRLLHGRRRTDVPPRRPPCHGSERARR